MKKKKSPAETVSPVQTQALGLSEEERAARNTGLQTSQGTTQQALGTTQQAAAPLQRYTSFDAEGMNPLRRSLTQAKTSATNTAYNNAQSANRLRGLSQGLQNQPMTFGNETALENERARTLGQIPSEVEREAVQPEMQAVGLMNQLAGTQLGAAGTQLGIAGQYSPESYFGQGAGMESQRQGALNEQWLDAERRRAAMWNSLIGAGTSIATAGIAGPHK